MDFSRNTLLKNVDFQGESTAVRKSSAYQLQKTGDRSTHFFEKKSPSKKQNNQGWIFMQSYAKYFPKRNCCVVERSAIPHSKSMTRKISTKTGFVWAAWIEVMSKGATFF